MLNCFTLNELYITVTTQPPTPRPILPMTGAAMCSSWGQEHYRTFDGKVYTFAGTCTYTLARDCDANTFTLNVINDQNCATGAACSRGLDLYMGSSKVSLENGNGSILLAPQMRHILASLDSVASAADRILKEAYNKLPPWVIEPRPQPAVWINSFVREI